MHSKHPMTKRGAEIQTIQSSVSEVETNKKQQVHTDMQQRNIIENVLPCGKPLEDEHLHFCINEPKKKGEGGGDGNKVKIHSKANTKYFFFVSLCCTNIRNPRRRRSTIKDRERNEICNTSNLSNAQIDLHTVSDTMNYSYRIPTWTTQERKWGNKAYNNKRKKTKKKQRKEAKGRNPET